MPPWTQEPWSFFAPFLAPFGTRLPEDEAGEPFRGFAARLALGLPTREGFLPRATFAVPAVESAPLPSAEPRLVAK